MKSIKLDTNVYYRWAGLDNWDETHLNWSKCWCCWLETIKLHEYVKYKDPRLEHQETWASPFNGSFVSVFAGAACLFSY